MADLTAAITRLDAALDALDDAVSARAPTAQDLTKLIEELDDLKKQKLKLQRELDAVRGRGAAVVELGRKVDDAITMVRRALDGETRLTGTR